MTIRPGKKLLSVVALLLLAGLVLGYFIHFRPKQAVERYKRELVARGEKLSVPELIPPAVVRSENSAANLQKAMFLLRNTMTLLDTNQPVAMRMVAPGRAMIGWRQTNIVDLFAKSPATNDWMEVAAVLAGESEAITLLHSLIEHPTVDWQLGYGEGFSLLLPHLATTKKTAMHLQAAALLELRIRNPTEAVIHLRAMLAITKASRDERLIISQLVRMAIANITFATTWSALQSPDLNDEQLAGLQRDWAELDFASGMEHALEMERAMAEMTLERMRNSSAEFRKISTGIFGGGGGGGSAAPSGDWTEEVGRAAEQGWDAARGKAKESAWRASWSLTDELTALKGHQVMLDTTRAARSNGCYLPVLAAQRAQLALLGITNRTDDDFNLFNPEPDLRTMFSDSIMSLERTLSKVMAAETSREVAITGIALRRFFLRHGHYPQTLAALLPEFLPTIPRDLVDGRPLRYRVVGTNAFVLYSIGKDGVDDGGDAANPDPKGSLSWQNGRDWVWPQPASEAEIEACFETQARKLVGFH